MKRINLSNVFVFAVVFVLVVFSASCKDDESPTSTDIFIFGHFYGVCIGESCVETYRLTTDKVYEDQIDSYGHLNFDFIELSNEDFLQVKDLPMRFPDKLWDESEGVLGCPDCADGGGIYIEYHEGERSGVWRMQTGFDTDSEYAYLNDFIDEVMNSIQELND